MIKLTGLQIDAIKRGEVSVLLKVLEDTDDLIINRLKNNKEETRYYQGASLIVDSLIKILR